MTVNNNKPNPEPASNRRAKRLKIIGGILWLAGLGGSGLVYWLGQRSAALMDDPAMLGFNHAEHRQMDVMFGKLGGSIDDLLDGLKQPGTQAILIIVVATLVAAGFFFFARPPEGGRETTGGNDSPPA